MFYCLRIAIVFTVVATWIASSTHAQNSNLAVPSGSVVDRLLTAQPTTPRYDNNVVRTTFDQALQRRISPGDGWTTDDVRAISDLNTSAPEAQKKPNFIQREKEGMGVPNTDTAAMPKKMSFGKLIANMGMNLAFVLLVGIGFIVISKQWMKPRAAVKKDDTSDNTLSLRIKEELVLDGKTSIRVIQWKDSEILVASDTDGVRSMVALTPNFSETFDQIETDFEKQEIEPAKAPTPSRLSSASAKKTPSHESNSSRVDDRLIQMLLDSANRSAAASKSYSNKGDA